MKKKVGAAIMGGVLLAAVGISAAVFMNKSGNTTVITSSQLEKAIDISQLSTAEFIYNGVAEKYSEKKPEKVECYIRYDANVKVGIQMEDVKFNINAEAKTITPVLPEIVVNIAALDENSISYMPENPDIELKEVIRLCKEDAINEANCSEKLYQTAQDNLRAVIEALLSPILDSTGYTIVW